ncbi:MAG: hypothetical protein HKO63_10060 [Acidimicrobiia bacterium]|nr:hypothetical protein [Acidimicrobiia bacterium]NNL98535.1 hypothetical protein [Acidimicrobiia bacterium]RZV47543.1 MAG: hypothetical protein EX267_00965 [Acidimicrobiia bacterium]
MRRVSFAGGLVIALLLSACGALNDGAGVGELQSIDRFSLSADRTTLEVGFVGGAPYDPDNPCSTNYEATSEWLGDVLEVGVVKTKGMGHGVGFGNQSLACPAMGYFRTETIDLDEPFDGSEIRDANGEHRRLFRTGNELATLTGLPSGWEVQVQSESPETRGGGWIKVYGPYDDPSQQVVFVQAFDGYPHIWRAFTGDERITVDGVDGRLFHTPNGHQGIWWKPGTEGYALYAFEDVFTLEELLALAETVQPGG